VTNLRRRLDNVTSELVTIRDMLNKCGEHPPCCLRIRKDGELSCEVIGPLPKKEFLRKCRNCRAEIRSFLERVGARKMNKTR
jgi:hypothetical protein